VYLDLKPLDAPSGDSSRSNEYGRSTIRPDAPASAGCILAAEGRLWVCVAVLSIARAHFAPHNDLMYNGYTSIE